MPNTRKELIKLRDDALNAAQPFHDQIRSEQAIYRNVNAYVGGERVGRVYSSAGESLYPKVGEVVDALSPKIEETVARADIVPDPKQGDSPEAEERYQEALELTEQLGDWRDMYDDAGGEGEEIQRAIHHNLVGGMAIRLVRWNQIHQRLECPTISPLCFAPDPDANKIDLSDHELVVHTNKRRMRYIKRHYPDFKPRGVKGRFVREDENKERHSIHELWLRAHLAEEIGIAIEDEHTKMVRAVLIEDEFMFAKPTPWIYPDYPFSCWRNFLEYDNTGKPSQFWGFGYPSLLWPQQKMLDHLLANLVLIVNNQATGRQMSPEGMFDSENDYSFHQLNMEYDAEIFNIADVLHLPPEQVPPALFSFVEYIVNIMERISGVTEVFTGSEPSGDLSGRAIAALQTAAATHVSSSIRRLNEFRRRLTRMKVSLIQQLAQRPVDRNLWRGGIDLAGEFPEEARHIGFTVEIPDASSLPQTPAAKLQIAQFLAASGAPLSLQKLLELIGIDKGYGLKSDDFQINPAEVQMIPLDETVAQGAEVEPDGRRQTIPNVR